jgi:CPA1 family monovalent cation:H+ antiporter
VAEISVVLVMLVAVVLSQAITLVLPFAVPLPLVQIALGALLAAVMDVGVPLNPEIFFLLFIPPLLFLDGWRIPNRGLFKDAGTILELALGLVVFTVLGMGFFIHWLIPAVPLPVAFALAAILSPTDPIAVSALTSRVPVPKRMMHILEGESLLNDASGLVCMRFALAAALTGTFSLPQAVASFLWVAVGGIGIGVGLTWVVAKIKSWLSQHFGENTGALILISLLIPFGAYLAAEHLHCSGILAAVAAGITMSYAELWGHVRGETRMQRTAVWNTVQFAANGAVFVLLGEQMPRILSGAAAVVREAGHHQTWVLAVYVLAITAALAALRFIWVWISIRFTLMRAARRGEARSVPSLRLAAAVSFAGVRGAITLAGVLTFPLAMPNGSAFPARELCILIAAGVIVLSLTWASISLPKVLTGLTLPPDDSYEDEEDRVRMAAAQAAMRAVQRAQERLSLNGDDADLYVEAADDVLALYRNRLEGRRRTADRSSQGRRLAEAEQRLWLAGVKAEREEIFKQARLRRIDDQTARKLVRELDLLEARIVH